MKSQPEHTEIQNVGQDVSINIQPVRAHGVPFQEQGKEIFDKGENSSRWSWDIMSGEKKKSANRMYELESGSEKSPQDHDIHNPNRKKHTPLPA